MEIDKEEFEKFYTNEIETEINNIKKEEKDVKTKALKKECPYLLLICVILYMLGHLWMSFIFILPYILVKLLNVANVDCGTKVFINNLMPKIVKFVDVNLEYIYNGINIEDFKKTCFTRDKIEGFSSYHLIKGKIGNVCTEFAEVTAYEKYRSNGRTNYRTIFEGFIFSADFNKSFQKTTLVFPDLAEKIFGTFGKNFQVINSENNSFELVNLENVEFERQFVVYGENQVESRYILTPNFMEKMLKVHNEKEARMFAFVDSKIYAGIKKSEEYFSYKKKDKIIQKEDVYNYCNKIAKIISIIEDLDLNTRIWSKE